MATNPYEDIFGTGHQPVNPYGQEFSPQGVPLLPSRQNPAVFGATAPTLPTSGTNPVREGGGALLERLLGGNAIGDVGSALGAFSQGEKANRIVKGNYTKDYDQMMIDREKDLNTQMLAAQTGRNQNETDALKKLQQTAYIGGGGNPLGKQSIQLGGVQRELPTYGLGAVATTDAEKQGAGTLQSMALDRLRSGGSFMPTQTYKPHDLDSYAKPGMAENIGSYGGVIGGLLGAGASGAGGSLLERLLGGGAGGGGALNSILGGGGGAAGGAAGAGGVMSNVMGKAVPLVGAGLGAYDLIKNDRGLASNALRGAATGASIGSVVPGLGTAVGAGIGAGVGALRGAFGVGEDEKAGRTAAAQGRQSIITGATPQQQAEAQAAGYDNPEDALAQIVVRDELVKAGKPPELADQLMAQLHQAEKQGPEAVGQVMQNMMRSLGGQQGTPTGQAAFRGGRPQGW